MVDRSLVLGLMCVRNERFFPCLCVGALCLYWRWRRIILRPITLPALSTMMRCWVSFTKKVGCDDRIATAMARS
jgi:hypothetical protein